jgi:alpha-tubulin suppressor-like RCC1 family protein
MISRARARLRVFGFLLGCLFVLLSVSAAAATPSSHLATATASGAAKISAHLTKTSFKASQASSVKLICKFSKKSGSFSYLLTFKKGTKWQTVKSVKKESYRKGSYTTTVKKVFAGKPVKVGSYRLKLSANGGSKLLSFKVIKAPVGSKPVNSSLPTISGTVKQSQTLAASRGSWSNSPTSYAYQWRRCDSAGASCSDISGAGSISYALAPADVSSTIRIVVTASNSYGSASAISSQTVAVATIPAISAGGNHTCALLSGGTVWCWGQGDSGELGNGSEFSRLTPVQVSGITNATQISAGWWHTCAVLSNGTVKCWGSNYDGQLGDGTTANSSIPVPISGITNATQISGGGYHTCALLSGGTVTCWGSNTAGSTPVQVSGISTATQISGGGYHTCALLSGGTVKCWGANDSDQLGDGTTTYSSIPVSVNGISTATQISAGDADTCALLSGGTVECWGSNQFGQLGNDGTTGSGSHSSTPVQVSGISNAIQISAGGMDQPSHTCALLSGGTVKCWGSNAFGQLGNGTLTTSSPWGITTPVSVSGMTNATQVSTGYDHTCALLSGGTVECWGNGGDGQLGTGTTDTAPTPISVVGLP